MAAFPIDLKLALRVGKCRVRGDQLAWRLAASTPCPRWALLSLAQRSSLGDNFVCHIALRIAADDRRVRPYKLYSRRSG